MKIEKFNLVNKNELEKDSEQLVDEFINIANKKWIKSTCKNFGSVGLTFEKELGKKPDSMYFPDYHGIEIKCTTRYSHYPLFLFTIAFDGPTFPEINRLVEKYGVYDKDFSDKKVLFTEVSCVEKIKVTNEYKFQLFLDRKNEKLFLDVYDIDDQLVERKSFVYFDSVRNHLELKLKKLAVVYASSKKISGFPYYRYYKIALYNLVSFDKFLYLLDVGVISASIISRIGKSGVDVGRYRNKNLVFKIRKDLVHKLFKPVYILDLDKEMRK